MGAGLCGYLILADRWAQAVAMAAGVTVADDRAVGTLEVISEVRPTVIGNPTAYLLADTDTVGLPTSNPRSRLLSRWQGSSRFAASTWHTPTSKALTCETFGRG
jgi:hypothetical protein